MSNLTALHPFIKTRNDINKLTVLMEKLEGELFKEGFNLVSFLKNYSSYDLKAVFEKTVKEAGLNVDNTADLRSFLANLREEIAQLPIVHIILSFSPSEKTVNTIHDWFFDNYNKIVLLDISIDKSIIAGSIISFNGRANDYSLATKIEASGF